MLQGTASHAGKTVLAAALCRLYARRGLTVAPFKAQNMALNSAVTAAGDEMGRAQVFQAAAAGVEPVVDMNPVLLKPTAGSTSQVVVMGRPVDEMTVASYQAYQATVWPVVTAALARLRAAHDLIVIEGAGSSAEVNLRHADIVNMRLARHAGAPVLLVGDIDRGGVFAALLGHVELFSPVERALVAGFIINKFRGDPAQLTPGLELLEERTGVPTLGVVPYLEGWHGDEEDSLALDAPSPRRARGAVEVAVVRLPYLSNTTDFDALAAEPDVSLRYVRTPEALRGTSLIVVPGTKSTVADLGWLRERGLDAAILAAAAAGVPVVGICGGYQMLGRRLRDPEGVESPVAESAGLGLLDVATTFAASKRTVRATGCTRPGGLAGPGLEVHGYEIHMGVTRRGSGARPFARLRPLDGLARYDGAVSADGLVCGTYLHGLFDAPGFRSALVNRLRRTAGLPERPPAAVESDIDGLARHVEDHLDIERLDAIIGLVSN